MFKEFSLAIVHVVTPKTNVKPQQSTSKRNFVNYSSSLGRKFF
jgi:hypothetical protein